MVTPATGQPAVVVDGRSRATSRCGFTLIEVLLALALGAMVLTTAAILLSTFGNLWQQRRQGDPFAEHVAGLRTFLQTLVDRSGSGGESDGGGSAVVYWSLPPGYPEYDKPYLTFNIAEPPAFLTAGATALPALDVWLAPVQGQGLFLIYHSRLIENRETEDLRHRLLSPWFEGISYAIFDPERDAWEETNEPPLDDSRNPVIPDAIILHFKLEEQTESIVLHLPVSRHVPLP